MAVDEQTMQAEQMRRLSWYHTIDLGGGLVTPGAYDHRPYLGAYGLPERLAGFSALDVGAASGFFTFELERRGGQVTSTELPNWMAHDFGPQYAAGMSAQAAEQYLHDPYSFAHAALRSQAERRLINVYDISPQTLGLFDLVFCGSVLLHLTDPARALMRIQSVTRQVAVIATVLYPLATPEPLARFMGEPNGFTWWYPNRAGFEALVRSAGFGGWEWFSEFRLDYADGQPGPYHGVIRAWNTPQRPSLLDQADEPPGWLIREEVSLPPAAVAPPQAPPVEAEPQRRRLWGFLRR
jgi:tRNA (mo5U34)-methyltransferase